MGEMTLVLGATGTTGRRVAARPAERGLPVRAGSRAGHPPFDRYDPATWDRALVGAGAVAAAAAAAGASDAAEAGR